MFVGILTHRASHAVGSLVALSTPLESNNITSIMRHYAAVPGNSEPMQSGPNMYKTECHHFTVINWLQLWGNIHDKKHSPNICLLVIIQNFDFHTANLLHISLDLKSYICPNAAPLTLLQLTVRMLRTKSFFLDPYNITNLNTLG